jgi:competence protein ComEC
LAGFSAGSGGAASADALLPAPKAAIAAGWLAAVAYSLTRRFFAVPTQRTLYMLSVVALALWSGRNLGASRSLLLALLLVLLIDPWAVLAPGFWLSFAAVGLLFFVGTARLGVGRGWRRSSPVGGRRSGR